MSQVPTLIILAGGASSRMWPLQEKLLLHFGEEPLLLRQLRRYENLGFQDVVIITSSDNHDTVSNLVAAIDGLNIQTVIQPEPKGMGDAMLQAEKVMDGGTDVPVYINQIHDIVDDQLHSDMLAAYRAQPDRTFLAGYEMEDYFPGGYLIVDEAQRIHGIVEKPGAENRPSKLVNIVAHIHAHAGKLFDAIREEYASDNPADDHYERAMDKLMKEQVYQVVAYNGAWKFIKFPWHVLDVMDYFLSQLDGQTIAESAYIAPGATVTGNVYIGENVRVFHGASIAGPAYIGAGTIIGNNSLVRQSMVLDHCEVGFTTEIARSYVGAHCGMHACRVLDSIFTPGVNFSAGCTTANLRIDKGTIQTSVKGQKLDTGRGKLGAIIGENAFLGVDVMTMPGVKIGAGAQVGPGTNVLHDILNKQRVYVKQQVVVVEDDSRD